MPLVTHEASALERETEDEVEEKEGLLEQEQLSQPCSYMHARQAN